MIRLRNAENNDLLTIREMLAGDGCDFLFGNTANASEYLMIILDGTAAGFIHQTKSLSYVFIFVMREYRNKRIAAAAWRECEADILSAKRRVVYTEYPENNLAGEGFALSAGFHKAYLLSNMEYRGAAFPKQALSCRAYTDGDYYEAHELYARAFHQMRLATGLFPDSVPEPSDERQRRTWLESADTRFVCEFDGAVAGYVHITENEISSISVKPELQGRGIGGMFLKELINMLLSRYNSARLCCIVGNRAEKLYLRTGFTERLRTVYSSKTLPY